LERDRSGIPKESPNQLCRVEASGTRPSVEEDNDARRERMIVLAVCLALESCVPGTGFAAPQSGHRGISYDTPDLKESSDTLTEEIIQLRLRVSIQRDTVDTHKAKVAKQAKIIKKLSNDEDTDVTISIEELQGTLQILKGGYVSLDKACKADMTRLDVLTNRFSTCPCT
jgi:hypothetical protein